MNERCEKVLFLHGSVHRIFLISFLSLFFILLIANLWWHVYHKFLACFSHFSISFLMNCWMIYMYLFGWYYCKQSLLGILFLILWFGKNLLVSIVDIVSVCIHCMFCLDVKSRYTGCDSVLYITSKMCMKCEWLSKCRSKLLREWILFVRMDFLCLQFFCSCVKCILLMAIFCCQNKFQQDTAFCIPDQSQIVSLLIEQGTCMQTLLYLIYIYKSRTQFTAMICSKRLFLYNQYDGSKGTTFFFF